MSIYVDNLESLVMTNASSSDEIVIISGFFQSILSKILQKKAFQPLFIMVCT